MKLNREFLMLSETLELKDEIKQSIGGWYCSEKLDGMRAVWLPDTKGQRIGNLPFANLDKDKTGSRDRLATGLWSRYARPIFCPASWTEQFPTDTPLDGELWLGRNQFQTLTSIVREKYPSHDWERVGFHVFDSPCYTALYSNGKIHNGQLTKNLFGVYDWAKANLVFEYRPNTYTFDSTYFRILRPLEGKKNIFVHKQTAMSYTMKDVISFLKLELDRVLDEGGEGLIIRAPHSIWEPRRSKLSLKVKPTNEDEAKVVGYVMGEGRLEGMIGSLTVTNSKGVTFNLSGMTDEQRVWPSKLFSIGTVVTYHYRQLTDAGVPREARFHRVRTDL